MEELIKSAVTSLLNTSPALAGIVMTMGTLRLIIKPIFDCLHKIVAATPTKLDDELLKQVDTSQIKQVMVYIIDYISSLPLKN